MIDTYAGFGTTFDEAQIEALRTRRREHVRYREEMLAFQKTCGREDKEFARFFAGCAADALRSERGATLALRYLAGDAAVLGAAAEILPYVQHEIGCVVG